MTIFSNITKGQWKQFLCLICCTLIFSVQNVQTQNVLKMITVTTVPGQIIMPLIKKTGIVSF